MSGQVADLHATPDRRTASRQSSLDEFAQTERNRRRFETEFLSLCACEPEMALTHANVLVQTKWHGQGHAPVAQALVDALAKDPTIPAADLVRQVQERIPGAESLLTSGSRGDSGDRQRLAAFLAEELSIGDMEEEVASLRTQLERPAEPLSPQEQEILFASVVAAQKDLNRRRREHKPLIG
jgi:DNA primase